MAFSSIKERRLRSALTVLGIVIGIAAIISLVSIGEGMRRGITDMLEQFGANKIMVMPSMQMGFGPPVIGESLTEDDLDDIKRVRGVDIAVPILFRSLPVEFNGESEVLSITGVDTEDAEEFFSDIQAFQLEAGRFQRSGDRYGIVIGYLIAKNVFSDEVKLNDRLEIKETNFEVIGIMNEMGNQQDDTMIILPLDTLRDMIDEETEITMFFIKVKDANRIEYVVDSIQKNLDDEHGEDTFMVMSTMQLTEQIGSITSMISVFLGGIAGISLLVAGIGISNTMLMSIMERTREIGIMKAVGATNKEIMEIFLIESAAIGLIGGILGCVIGIGISRVISTASSYFFGMSINTAVTPELISIGLGFAVGVGVVSGLFPARRAAKLKPVEALRYE